MVSVEEYLTTSYEADREYVDGEVLERHSGEQPHANSGWLQLVSEFQTCA